MNTTKLYSAAGLCLVIGFAWYFLIYQPQERQRAQTAAFGSLRCFVTAAANYENDWNSQCAAHGLSANCSLPVDLATALDNRRSAARAECAQRYPEQRP